MSFTELMGVEQASSALGVSRSLVHHLVRQGTLVPAGRIGKRGQYVFDAADVNDLARVRAADNAL